MTATYTRLIQQNAAPTRPKLLIHEDQGASSARCHAWDALPAAASTIARFLLPPSGTSSRDSAAERRADFGALAVQWMRETRHLSSDHEIAMHPSYQRIIGMGAEGP